MAKSFEIMVLCGFLLFFSAAPVSVWSVEFEAENRSLQLVFIFLKSIKRHDFAINFATLSGQGKVVLKAELKVVSMALSGAVCQFTSPVCGWFNWAKNH